MVHKYSQWNISKSKGDEIAHKYITECLCENERYRMNIKELINLLNIKTKHINFINRNQKKPFSVYIKDNYGSFIQFIDNHLNYGIMDNSYVVLINHKNINSTQFNINTWEMIKTEEDFILV